MKRNKAVNNARNRKKHNRFIGFGLLMLAFLFGLTGCVNEEPQPIIPEPVVEEKPLTPFEIVTVDVGKITTGLETNRDLYKLEITNHSDKPIKVRYVDFDVQGRTENVSINKTIDAKSSVVALRQTNWDLLNATLFRYDYSNIEGDQKWYYVDVRAKHLDVYVDEARQPNLPLIPNNGLTIFAWEENGKWRFDYLMGRENDTIYTSYFPNNSLMNALIWHTDSDIYLYIRSLDGDMNDQMEAYIRQHMWFLTKYQDITFVLEGEEDKFEELNQKFGLMRTVVVFPGSSREGCNFTYCAELGHEGGNLYAFSEEQKEVVGKQSYTIDELKLELAKYQNLSMFVRGKNQEFTESVADEIRAVFNTIEIYPEIENSRQIGADKPVIYLYVEKEMAVSVEVDYLGTLRTTYPEYQNGWDVIAKPDGTLINKMDKREYSYLFWEGIGPVSYPMDTGFVVKKEDTISFLQEKLELLGLTPREYNEFIVYWLPHLQEHEYNLIVFQDEVYESIAKLNINPKPDSIQRVFMTFKGLEKPMDIKPQVLKPFKRSGFTVIEWGGVEIVE